MLIERELAAFSTWYEYFPRSCAYDGNPWDFYGRRQTTAPLSHKMGFNIVYFPPIHPVGRKFRKGKNNTRNPSSEDVGSPWAVGKKVATNPFCRAGQP